MTDPQRSFAEDVVRTLTKAGHQALWAGGCVRDLLLGRTPKDYDVATSARPDQVREVFGRRRTLAVGESFGVIVVLGPKDAGQVEVATFRTDGEYLDGRRPDSVQFSSPEEDAQRRDFTINGMFYDPLTQQVHDFVGGQHDLAAGVLRAIGVPRDRMTEDKLRMLRAVRFASTFDFQLDPATADAVRDMAGQIHVVSPERIAQELRRMLTHANRHRALELCRDVRLLEHVLPELSDVVSDASRWQHLLAMLRLLDEPGFPLALAALLDGVIGLGMASSSTDAALRSATEQVQALGLRLKLSNRETDDAAWLLSHRDALHDAARQPLCRLKRVLANSLAHDLIQLLRVRSMASDQAPQDAMFCADFLDHTPREILDPPPLITGNDLIQSGLRPGPQFKDILEAIRDAQLNLQISTSEEARCLAQELS